MCSPGASATEKEGCCHGGDASGRENAITVETAGPCGSRAEEAETAALVAVSRLLDCVG